MVKFNDVLQEIEELTLEEQEYLLEIVKKRIIDKKRHYLIYRAKEAEKAYHKGEVFGGTAEELIGFLND